MAKVKTQFLCSNCGYISPKYLGRCPNCGEWGTLVEERIQPDTPDRKSRVSLDGEVAKVAKIGDVSTEDTPRIKVQLSELNRVLGGGVVPGSMVLIGGDPGIGKSTLLLQMSGQLAQTGGLVLYVSGEESAVQIKMRAERLGVGANDFYLYPETDMSLIRKQVDELKPNFLIIDSIQTMQEPDVQSAVGSVSQVREVTAELLQIAKTNGITVFIVGHVTKEGSIAGPKMLEHMVDTVLYFEGDLHHAYRILRAVKNRFGSTNELGIFEMQTHGLTEVANPSQIFLEERIEGATGSAIVVSMEGTRPILVEMQALITPSVFGNAQRTASGLDRNRVSLIMAVLEKRANLLLQNQDAFLKAAGGVKLDEPAIDLAVAVAVASSYQDKETQLGDAFIGEIGLTGEIRRVNRIEERVAEAEKLGFKRVFVPKNNLQGWQPVGEIEVVGVATISEALQKAFNGKTSKYRINTAENQEF
ncbi:DNA repair protein RadA [Periweissella ghanensis]|uniref:DNA repair protein RadA n=1 Tax=Periweissella ghanensis TaxID=467997 RepID=A0ABN8BS37_9LACO|nr:DNA repair protein RadA [Periweissella ghanensis]MCM0600043.1 DNA repair protein RadA [Periweissella ghanensis]CAH0418994.1 DNA repair protein RadA [Periweissella ghanensis]